MDAQEQTPDFLKHIDAMNAAKTAFNIGEIHKRLRELKDNNGSEKHALLQLLHTPLKINAAMRKELNTQANLDGLRVELWQAIGDTATEADSTSLNGVRESLVPEGSQGFKTAPTADGEISNACFPTKIDGVFMRVGAWMNTDDSMPSQPGWQTYELVGKNLANPIKSE